MDEIIKKAIEGGYKDPRPKIQPHKVEDEASSIIMQAIMNTTYNPIVVTDSLFWQSLGKSSTWTKNCQFCKNIKWIDSYGKQVMVCDCDNNSGFSDEWKMNALEFHEINLTEGWDKAVSWLNNLIK